MLYIIITFAKVTSSRHRRQEEEKDCRNGFLPRLRHAGTGSQEKELTKTTRHGQLFRTFTRTPQQQTSPQPLASSPPQGGQFGDLQAQLAERAEEAQDNIKGAFHPAVDTGGTDCSRLHRGKLHVGVSLAGTKLESVYHTSASLHTIVGACFFSAHAKKDCPP